MISIVEIGRESAQNGRSWSGTPSVPLATLDRIGGTTQRGRSWQPDATRRSGVLRRIAPILRPPSIRIEGPKKQKGNGS